LRRREPEPLLEERRAVLRFAKKDPVVSTGASRSEAEWRDLLSANSRLLVEKRSLHSALRAPVETTELAF